MAHVTCAAATVTQLLATLKQWRQGRMLHSREGQSSSNHVKAADVRGAHVPGLVGLLSHPTMCALAEV